MEVIFSEILVPSSIITILIYKFGVKKLIINWHTHFNLVHKSHLEGTDALI